VYCRLLLNLPTDAISDKTLIVYVGFLSRRLFSLRRSFCEFISVVTANISAAGQAGARAPAIVFVFSTFRVSVFPSSRTWYVNEVDVGVA